MLWQPSNTTQHLLRGSMVPACAPFGTDEQISKAHRVRWRS